MAVSESEGRHIDQRMNSSSSSSEHQLLNSLSESLLVEILVRVPSSRAVNRLRLACKTWNSIISSDYFITLFNHRRHDLSLPPIPPDSYSLVFQIDNYFNPCALIVHLGYVAAEYHAHQMLDLSFLPHPQSEIEIRASFADLLLCSYSISQSQHRAVYFYVCNILTKQWVALPCVNFEYFDMYEFIGFVCVPAPCSLYCHKLKEERCCGVDNSNYKFAVVCFYVDYAPEFYEESVSEFKVQLYLSEESGWRSYVVSSPREIPCKEIFSFTTSYRGMLHCLFGDTILVYDPFNSPERFSRVIDMPPRPQPLPQPLRHPDHFCYIHSFGIRRGDRLSAALTNIANPDDVYIWELEDYDIGKWCLVFPPNVVSHFHEFVDEMSSLSRGYIHIDGNAICFVDDSSIWLWNMQSGTMDQLLRDASHLHLYCRSVHKVVNLRWPTPVPPPRLSLQPCTTLNDGNTDTIGNLNFNLDTLELNHGPDFEL